MDDQPVALAFLVGTTTIAVVLATATWADPFAPVYVLPAVLWTLYRAYRGFRDGVRRFQARLARLEAQLRDEEPAAREGDADD